VKCTLELQPVTASNLAELHQACFVEDGHIVPPGATDLFRRDGEIVAAISLFSPAVMFWAHTRKLKAPESFRLLHRCKALARERNPNFLVCCSSTSPFRQLLEPHFGFRLLGGVDVFEDAEK